MQKVGWNDLRLATRALTAQPLQRRTAFCAQLIAQAHAAEAYYAEHQKLHPVFGDGTLAGAALGHPLGPDRWLSEPETSAAALALLDALNAHLRPQHSER